MVGPFGHGPCRGVLPSPRSAWLPALLYFWKHHYASNLLLRSLHVCPFKNRQKGAICQGRTDNDRIIWSWFLKLQNNEQLVFTRLWDVLARGSFMEQTNICVLHMKQWAQYWGLLVTHVPLCLPASITPNPTLHPLWLAALWGRWKECMLASVFECLGTLCLCVLCSLAV